MKAVRHRVVGRHEPAAFHEERPAAMGVQLFLEDVRGLGEGAVVVAMAEGHARGDVGWRSRMRDAARRARSPSRQSDAAGSMLVIDLDERCGVFGDIARVGDHHRDRLADITSFVLGQRHAA